MLDGTPGAVVTATTQGPSILCVHQGFDLYGSDRTFLQSLRAIRRRFPVASIDAVLPGRGALLRHVERLVDRVELIDMQVIRRGLLSRMRPSTVLAGIRRAVGMINRHDLTYINTSVILDFILAARFARRRALVHVHELPVGAEGLAFSGLLAASGAPLVFNSEATRDAFVLPPWQRRHVVHNGTVAPSDSATPAGQGLLGRDMNVLMLGRFNTWKGQSLLVDAVGRMSSEHQHRMRVRLVGDAFQGQNRHRDVVELAVARKHLRDRVTIEPFVDDPSGLYGWSDVVVVPSTRPEPFGMVAIEAMACGRPVIGAAHGGLTEIVRHDRTGVLFSPGDPAALAGALARYRDNATELAAHGLAAQERFRSCFDERTYLDAIGELAAATLEADRR